MSSPSRDVTPAFAVGADRSVTGLGQLRAAGELDLVGAPRLLAAVDAALVGAPVIVLDLRQLTFCDTAGVHAVLDADAHAREAGAWLVILPAAREVHRTFELTGADRLLQVFGTPASGFTE